VLCAATIGLATRLPATQAAVLVRSARREIRSATMNGSSISSSQTRA
jgi:hypothetical protein